MQASRTIEKNVHPGKPVPELDALATRLHMVGPHCFHAVSTLFPHYSTLFPHHYYYYYYY
jgi:hypothetical protein